MDLDALAERDRARRLRQLKNAKRQGLVMLLCMIAGLVYIFVHYLGTPRGASPAKGDKAAPAKIAPPPAAVPAAPVVEPPPTPDAPAPVEEKKADAPASVKLPKSSEAPAAGTIRDAPSAMKKLLGGETKPEVPVANVLASIGVTDSEKSKRQLPKVTEAKRVLDLLGKATDVSAKLEYVVLKPGTEERMKTYYQSGMTEPQIGERTADFETRLNGDRYLDVIYRNPTRPSGTLHASFLRDEKGMVRLDWESFVGHGPMSLREFRERKPETPVALRVYASIDDYHNYEFIDAKKFLSVRLRNADGSDAVNGFCETGGRVATAINARLSAEAAADAVAAKDDSASAPKRTWAAVIVKVRFPAKPQSDHCVELIDLINGQWLAPAGLVE